MYAVSYPACLSFSLLPSVVLLAVLHINTLELSFFVIEDKQTQQQNITEVSCGSWKSIVEAEMYNSPPLLDCNILPTHLLAQLTFVQLLMVYKMHSKMVRNIIHDL